MDVCRNLKRNAIDTFQMGFVPEPFHQQTDVTGQQLVIVVQEIDPPACCSGQPGVAGNAATGRRQAVVVHDDSRQVVKFADDRR